MVKKLITLILPAVLPVVLYAQEKIETERPTETQNAGLVPKGRFQAELGFRREQQDAEHYSYIHPNAYFRYGLFNHFEIRLRTPFETERIMDENKSNYGLRPVEVGFKAR